MVVSVAGATSAIFATNQDGRVSLLARPEETVLTITADGFTETRRTVRANEAVSDEIVIELQVAAQSQTMTVEESPTYVLTATGTATKTNTPLIDVPQSVSVVTRELMRDQLMMSIADVVRYVPGIIATQGENNRDQLVIRGNASTADFFVNGVRDDVQYYRDLYNLDRVEALKGPNAMIFGRGGGGGVINRVTKEAGFTPLREITLQGGSFGHKRLATDFDHAFNDRAAFRVNAMYENSGSFRENSLGLERYGVNPTITLFPTQRTKVLFSYENFRDDRNADRGIPSFLGRPADLPVHAFFGNPKNSQALAKVNLGSALIEHQAGRFNIRNRTMVGDYDKLYQNYVPGAVNPAMTLVGLSGYNNATERRNIFNQTDVTFGVNTGFIRHTILFGAEAGRQRTANLRQTAYFNGSAVSVNVPFTNGVVDMPVVWRPSATDADNRLRARVAATYVQDQMELSRYLQFVVGFRFDNFDLRYVNNRAPENFRRTDNLSSPRAGIVVKPAQRLSLYTSYSISWLPSSGDQFASLTTVTEQVKPEKFTNYEAGIKWDLTRDLSLTTAFYRLDRTNTRSVDPNDPTRIIQTGSQRTSGAEIGINGSVTRKWRLAGAYSYQDAFISSATAGARAGLRVAQVPRNTFSLWNNYQLMRRLSAGLGLLNRANMFAAIDNTVLLPGYTRADAAVYYSFTEKMRLQANIENLTNRRYFANADGNNNLGFGSPRAVRVALVVAF
ncbi:MAG: TonB-dependent siderophore receptor [Bryobacterales bacterium]|nr:TonB-dependent siderophore receptor [Bryobacterales bacterium]